MRNFSSCLESITRVVIEKRLNFDIGFFSVVERITVSFFRACQLLNRVDNDCIQSKGVLLIIYL